MGGPTSEGGGKQRTLIALEPPPAGKRGGGALEEQLDKALENACLIGDDGKEQAG
jgi:hypothetical protein